MKCLLNILFLFCFWNCFSQDSFQDEPKEFKKIHFVYEERSNYFLNDSGVYADTLLLAFDFPKLKYTKVESPFKTNTICGFLPFSAFSNPEDKLRLVGGALYHTNQTYKGTYYVNRNKTKINVIRNNKEIKEKVKKYFDEYFPKHTYDIVVNYKNETENTIFIGWFGNEEKTEGKNRVTYLDDEKLTGSYTTRNAYIQETKTVVFNKKLNAKIVPAVLFFNADYGVEKIITLFETYELKSVTYE